MRRLNGGLATLLFCVVISNTSVAGQLEKLLEEKLRTTAAMEKIQVLIYLKDQVDLEKAEVRLRTSFPAGRIPVHVRYLSILDALQTLVNRTQPAFRQNLNRYFADGTLTIQRSFWIRNMLVVQSTPNTLRQIAAMPEVETVFYDGYLERELPVTASEGESHPQSAEPGLRVIHADKLWGLGYTGAGRLVMNIDTGVEGNNQSLNARWRGTVPGVQPGWAWFDPETNTIFPIDGDGNTQHGTHTMGIMCGLYESIGDTLGVAPGAHWIAAKTLTQLPHTSHSLAAFQWAANPDSNVNTMDDVPDVINCSWYDPNVSGTECTGASGYYSAVDALEALGIAVVFSAGNFGPGPSTITPPKNRLTTGTNFFSVGAINGNASGYPIANFSSRGPSVCVGPDSLRIKPEVVAPGVGVRSAAGINSYRVLDGTSMASPHIAGSIALLRQAAPFMTGTEIKYILMNTAAELGTPGEDNTYGHGLIDLEAAYLSLPLAAGFARGRITGNGSPLSGARVDFVEPEQQHYSISDVDGYYTVPAYFDTLAPVMQFSLQVRRFGYLLYTDTLTMVPNDTVTRNINLKPMPTGTLQLHAYNNTENMQVDAKVIFEGTTVVEGLTDPADGILSVPLPQGSYDVFIDPQSPYGSRMYTNISVAVDSTSSIETLLRYVIEPSLADLHDTLNAGQTNTKTLTLTNTTNDSVAFRISDDELPSLVRASGKPDSQQQYITQQLPEGTRDKKPRHLQPGGQRGLDPFGYEWIDSDEPGGPVFQWEDISNIGTVIPTESWIGSAGASNADDGQTHLALPFIFNFYGNSFDSLKLCTNGWIGFNLTSTSTEHTNSPIPSASEPNSAIYPWWDDLDLRTSGAVHYYHDGTTNRFIIQYTNAPHSTGTSGKYSFQVILNPSGNVEFAYLSMQQTVSSATIGIENPAGDTGLMIVHNASYMHDSLAILLSAPGTGWLTEFPSSGILPPQSSRDIAVTFNSNGLTPGVHYNTNIIVSGTHPDIGAPDAVAVTVPAVLTVAQASGVKNTEGLPSVVMLSQNYPNPFNPSTTIDFALPEQSDITLRIFDLLGREVRLLARGIYSPGDHRMVWDSRNNKGDPVAGGTYFCRFEAISGSGYHALLTTKLLLLK